MRNRKRVLKGFHYWECDSFGDYLHNMSAEGWHFVEWKLGLIFERGESRDYYYDVEAFPKGSEMDKRPEPDTEEYAEYCEAAGWKFIDSKQRFCVFRREQEDALPIVTQEERLQNIKKAGWRKWVSDSIGMLFITILIWLEFLTINFERWIFFDLMLFLILAVTVGSITKILECFVMILEGHKKKAEIAAGNIPYYGGKFQAAARFFRNYMWVFVITIASVIACIQKYYYLAVIVLVFVSIIFLITAVIAVRRPSRADNWIFQIGGALGLLMVIVPVIVLIAITAGDQQINNLSMQEIPLLQSDYKETAGKIDLTDEGHFQGVLGSMSYFLVRYDETTNSVGDSSDSLWYYVYESSHSWILNKIWKQHLEKADGARDCTQEWRAEAAVCSGSRGTIYTVLYQEKLLYLYSNDPLDEEQIDIIRTKLKLGEIM